MSKRKGDFRSKIDSILSEGAEDAPGAEGSTSLDSMLTGGAAQPRRPRRDVLADLVTPTTETKLDQISLDQISLPVGRRADQNVSDLLDSVRSVGVVQPLLLRPVAGGYEVVDGGRRLVAAQRAGLTSVPAVVRTLSDADALSSASTDRAVARRPARSRKPGASTARPVARIAKKSARKAVAGTVRATGAAKAAKAAKAATPKAAAPKAAARKVAAPRKVAAAPISAPKRTAKAAPKAKTAAKVKTASRRVAAKATAKLAPKIARAAKAAVSAKNPLPSQ